MTERVSCTSGIPPPLIPDTYGRTTSESQEVNPVPANLAFAKTLSAVQTEGIIQLERSSLSTPPKLRAAVLNPIIENVTEQLLAMLVHSSGDLGEHSCHFAYRSDADLLSDSVRPICSTADPMLLSVHSTGAT